MQTGRTKKLLSLLLSAVMLLGLIPFVELPIAFADTWDGTYTINTGFSQSGSTYTISSARGLAYFIYTIGKNNGTTYEGCTVNLNVDVDLNGIDFGNGSGGKNVYYYGGNEFEGTFNGNNHTISNFTMINDETAVGLFRSARNATFKNIIFTGVNVYPSGNKDGYAALVGYAKGTLTIDNVKVNSGTITGYNYVGGIVGEYADNKQLTITNCSNAATIKSNNNRAAGIVGYCKGYCSASNCSNSGTITAASSDGGGIVGWIEDDTSSFNNCTNTGNVTAKSCAGGIFGYMGSKDGDKICTITNCTNRGTIHSTNSNAGGIAGKIDTDARHIFTNNYNYGSVTGNGESAGGIVGVNSGSGTWSKNYNYGAVSGSVDNAGGILGEVEDDPNTFSECYNSANVTGPNSIGGILGYGHEAIHSFTNCGNSGNVTSANDNAGGIFGYSAGSSGMTFTQCWNVGTIKAKNDGGGIVGKNYNHTIITRCFNAGSITGSSSGSGSKGGLIGYTGDYSSTSCITDSYNWGAVSVGNYCGGLVGFVRDRKEYKITYSYNAGTVSSGNTTCAIMAGGSGYSSTVYYDMGKSMGTAQSSGVTDANLIAKTITTSSNIVKNTWGVKIGSTTYYYPVLTWYRDLFSFTSNFVDTPTSTNTSYTKLYNNAFTAPNPSRTGYTSGAWYNTANTAQTINKGASVTAGVTAPTNAYVVTQSTSNVQSISNSTTYNLKSTAHTYTVAYNGNDATAGSMGNQTFEYNVEKALSANNYTRAYTVTYKNNNGAADTSATATATFNGWATTASGAKVYNNQQSVKNLTSTNGAVIELFANWTLGSVTLPTPVKNGYTFKGWYSDSTLNTFVGNGGAAYTPTANATLYAKWETADYTVSFNADGGDAVPQLGYKITDSKTLPSTSKAGYTFNNWKVTTAAGSWTANATFNAGASVNGKYGSPTLTAQYTPTNYTVTYNVDGVTSTATYNIESAGKLPAKEKTGYDFAGWAISGNTGNWTETTNLPADTALAGRYGDVTLTAQWTPKTYGISYTLGDGASAANQPLSVEHGGSYTFTVTVDEAHDQTMPTVTATGAAVSQTVSGNVVTVSLTNVTGEVAVNVPTAINTYAFTLNGDEGFTSDDKAQTVDYGSTVTFTVTLSEGYTQTAPTVMQGETALTPKTVEGSAYTYEIENVTSNITVDVTATKNVYAVTVDAEANGDVVASGESIQYGGTYSFSVTPKTGYTQHAPTVKVNGAAIEAASVTDGTYNYVIENVTEALAIDVDFTINTYTITWNDEDGTLLATTTANHGETPTYPNAAPTKEATAQYTYAFAGWGDVAEATADATYTASYSFTVNKYTVKFVNEDGTELQSESLEYGTMPEYKGEEPEKERTQQYSYSFKDWDQEIVTVEGDATYTATFDSTVNQYKVQFVNEDGTLLKEYTLDYGATPAYDGETPEKAADLEFTYTFKDWTPAIADVTDNAIYTATYDKTVIGYLVRFLNDDGAVLQENYLHDGDVPAYTGEIPEKAPTAQYTYTFTGWSPEIVPATADTTYTAQFSETLRSYNISFVTPTGTNIISVPYGETPAPGFTPAKSADAENTYAFAGWSTAAEGEVAALAVVDGAATYYAIFTATPIPADQYLVTGTAGIGTSISDITGNYAEGTGVSFDVTVAEGYDPTDLVVSVNGTALANPTPVNGVYSYTLNVTGATKITVSDLSKYTYTIKFIVDEFETEKTVAYGEKPDAGFVPTKAQTTEYSYAFTGWNTAADGSGDPLAPATADETYYAVFTPTAIPAHTHSFDTFVRTVAATCVSAGYDEYICDCGMTQQLNQTAIDANNHAKEPITVGARAATETEDGYTGDLICPACGETITAGHVEPKTAVPHEHDFATLISHADATCAAKAYDIYACECGETKKIETGEVNPDNHVGLVTVGAKDATETKYGYTGDTVCTACGSVLATGEVIEKTVVPHFHSFDTVIEEAAATCVAKAYVVKQCACGATERSETGEVDPENHAGSIILVGAREATVTMGGYTGDKICTACGATVETGAFTDPSDPGHTHDYAEIVETGEATCVSKAYTIYQCACGDTKKVETGSVDPANHAGEIKTLGAREATATVDGYTGDKYCLACGKLVEEGSVIPHTGSTTPDTPDDGGSNSDTRISFIDWLLNLIKIILALFNFGGEGSVC